MVVVRWLFQQGKKEIPNPKIPNPKKISNPEYPNLKGRRCASSHGQVTHATQTGGFAVSRLGSLLYDGRAHAGLFWDFGI